MITQYSKLVLFYVAIILKNLYLQNATESELNIIPLYMVQG